MEAAATRDRGAGGRQHIILKLAAEGATLSAIALQVGVGKATVYPILALHRKQHR